MCLITVNNEIKFNIFDLIINQKNLFKKLNKLIFFIENVKLYQFILMSKLKKHIILFYKILSLCPLYLYVLCISIKKLITLKRALFEIILSVYEIFCITDNNNDK